MKDTFDPYYEWLSIPAKEQPPDHYRLLAIARFEANENVIQNAYDQRMAYLKTKKTSAQVRAAEKLQGELTHALRVLLDSKQRSNYDGALRENVAKPLPSKLERAVEIAATEDRPLILAHSAADAPRVTIDNSTKGAAGRASPAKPRRGKSASLIATMVMVVIGGATAIPTALMLLWGIAGIDPLGIFSKPDKPPTVAKLPAPTAKAPSIVKTERKALTSASPPVAKEVVREPKTSIVPKENNTPAERPDKADSSPTAVKPTRVDESSEIGIAVSAVKGRPKNNLDELMQSSLSGEERKKWVHDKGLFTLVGTGKWEEIAPDNRKIQFEESARTDEYVELSGVDGVAKVRLHRDICEVSFRPFVKFETFYTGKWEPLPQETVPVPSVAEEPSPLELPPAEKKPDRSSPEYKLWQMQAEYKREREALGKVIVAHLDKREEIARRQGNKKLVDELAGERTSFLDKGMVPSSLPAAALKKIRLSRSGVEGAFEGAIKEYTKADNDMRAGVLAQQHREFMATESADLGDLVRLYPNAWYRLVNVHSGKALGVANGGSKVADRLVQLTDDASDLLLQWQMIHPVKSEPTRTCLQNRKSGMVVNITLAAKTENTRLIQYKGSNAPNECWQLEYMGAFYVVRSSHSGLVMTVVGGAKHELAEVSQESWLERDEQKWRLVRVR